MIVLRAARTVLAEVLRRRGYELKQLGQPPRGFDNFLKFYQSRRIPPPATIFDVGVGHGTPWLYGRFPGSKLVLVEPLKQFDASVQSIAKTYDADVLPFALSDRNGVTRMRVTPATPTGSSLLARSSELESFRSAQALPTQDTYIEIETRRLDDVSSSYAPPYIVKLDVEGAESLVLSGAQSTLARTDMLLLEISVMPRHVGEPSFAEMIRILDDSGFRLVDIVDLAQGGPSGPLIYVDAAFVRKDLPFWAPS